jgi:hypothetical protein
MFSRLSRRYQNHLDPAFQSFLQGVGNRRDRDGLVLNVDRVPSSVDGKQVLIEDRVLAFGDRIRSASRAGGAVAVMPSIHIALDLYDAAALWIGNRRGKRKLAFGARTPPSALQFAIAGLIPPLNEVMMRVGRSWPAHLDINIVAVSLNVAGGPTAWAVKFMPPMKATSEASPASMSQLFWW